MPKGLKLSWWSLVSIIALIGFISDRSGYSIVGGVDTINIDVALMLTPWGFIHNWFIASNHYLKPYYFQTSHRSDLFNDPVLFTLVFVLSAASILSLYWLRRTGRSS